jgi:4-diphosphocytidyl-2-C-methyl-D-erythritol kinase
VSASDGNTASEWVPTGSVTVRVPGKVNLYLAVGDRRDDGYHELTTIFHAVSLLDEVTVSNADVLALELSGEGVESLPTDERNLAWQAAELMAEHVGRAPDVAISIDKSIPVAGGMAGGSADAAAVLVAMNTLWELGVPRRDLHALAAQLGSDVPFALHGGTALGTGRGEELATVLARSTFHWVLAFAEGGLSTPAVFSEIDRLRDSGREQPPRLEDPEPMLAALASGDPVELAPLLGNDLQPAALSLDPGLRRTPVPKPAHWPESCRGPARHVHSCARRRPRLSTWARSWLGRGYAAQCGWPAGRCMAPGWCPRHRGRFDYDQV